jgi:peptidoglycan/LPS O-acetylase OafA/YrhL
MSAGRSTELDSIRGIAAFVVVLFHCWQTILPRQEAFPFADAAHPIAKWIALSPLRLLIAGHAAVGIFFVLSGYVLAQSLARTASVTYAQFIVRRVCRIWLPFVAAILVAAALYICVEPKPLPGHAWLNGSWNEHLSVKVLVGHLLMIGTPSLESLDSPMWSLVHEMRLSLVFPLLVLAVTLRPRPMLAATLAALIVLSSRHFMAAIGAVSDANEASALFFSLCETARYSAFFVLGILLAQHPAVLGSIRAPKAILWCLTFALLWIPYVAGIVDLAYAVGAFLLIALCLQSAMAHTLLAHPVPHFLGKISYSLYLLHLPIILAFEHVMYGKVNEWLILALGIGVALLAATISYRYVELPSIRLGKLFAERVRLAGSRLSPARTA